MRLIGNHRRANPPCRREPTAVDIVPELHVLGRWVRQADDLRVLAAVRAQGLQVFLQPDVQVVLWLLAENRLVVLRLKADVKALHFAAQEPDSDAARVAVPALTVNSLQLGNGRGRVQERRPHLLAVRLIDWR